MRLASDNLSYSRARRDRQVLSGSAPVPYVFYKRRRDEPIAALRDRHLMHCEKITRTRYCGPGSGRAWQWPALAICVGGRYFRLMLGGGVLPIALPSM